MGVAHAQQSGVLSGGILQVPVIVAAGDPAVAGPVQRFLLRQAVQRPVVLRHVKRLVGVKAFDLQKPVVPVRVLSQKLQPGADGAGAGHFVLRALAGAVAVMLLHRDAGFVQRAGPRRDLRPDVVGHIAVAFLAAEPFPGIVAVVIGRAAVLPVVRMVGAQMAVHPVLAQHLEHRAVERLQRAPAAVQEIVFAGMQLPPGRHAGQAAAVKVVEPGAVVCQAGKVGQLCPVAAVVRQEFAGQGIEHDHNGTHSPFLLSAEWYSRNAGAAAPPRTFGLNGPVSA